MRVVITGGAGRLGRYVCAAVRQHHDVIVADRATAVPDGRTVIDVLNPASLRSAFAGAGAVVHLAGVDYDFHVRAVDTLQVNALGTWNVLEASALAGVSRVVVCSSVAAMGLHEMRENWKPQFLPITEEHPVSPVEPYSVSKAAAETMARSFVDGGQLDVVCLRPCTVVTAENVDELLDPDAEIFLGEYISATDCGEAFLAALDALSPGFGPYLVAADDTLSERGTLEFLSETLGALPANVDREHYRTNPRSSGFDTTAIRRALDWSPRTTRAELRSAVGLAEC